MMPATKLVARTFILALHAFRLLYSRTRVYPRRKWLILFLGWLLVAFVASIGPLTTQNSKKGPYFGPSGFWYAAYCLLSAVLIFLKVLDH